MKRLLMAALAALFLMPTAAFADADGFWTANEGWYYHASEHCGGAEDMVPISLEGAAAFEKYPCPVCVPTQESDEIRAAVVFGQLVLRIPDTWLAELENPGLPRTDSEPDGVDEYGEQALQTLGYCLHGEVYTRFLEELRKSGSTEATAVTLQALPTGDDIILSSRHIGDAWYVCVRTAENPEEGWDLSLGIREVEIQMEGEALHTRVPYRIAVKTFRILPELVPDVSYIYQREGIQVYKVLDGYFLDLIMASEKEAELAKLWIGGTDSNVELAPWRSGDVADYGCALTEAEFRALENGAALERITDSDGHRIAFSGDME